MLAMRKAIRSSTRCVHTSIKKCKHNINDEQFVDTVNSHPWRGAVPSEGLEQWRDQLLDLVQSMSIQDRESACGRVPSLVWVELVKPSIRAEHLDVLNGTKIDKHDISDWYAIPIEFPDPVSGQQPFH